MRITIVGGRFSPVSLQILGSSLQEVHPHWKCGVMNDCLLFLCADYQEPYAVVVLLEKDLVVIDLAQNG